MRRWIPLAFLFLLIGFGTSPLWRTPADFLFLPDAFPHLFRFFEFDRVIQTGVLYPRWSAELASGYGYPLFNFYSPLAYYIVEALHLLGLPSAHAILFSFALIVAIAVTGAYALGCELGNSRPIGFVTAAAYVFFPYFLTDLYGRGALAESLGAAILPWLVWSWRRVLTRKALGALILAGIFSALIVLSHNLVAYMSMPLLAAFAIWELAHLPANERLRAITRVASAILSGAALAAIFWLPVLAELSLITDSQPSKQIAAILHNSFLAPSQLIQFSAFFQYGDDPYPLAVVPLTLSAFAFVLTLVTRKKESTVIFFFGAMIVEMFFLLDWSESIWLRIPLLSTSQFAWRLQVLIGLSVAVTIGFLPRLVGDWLGTKRTVLVRALPGALIALVLIVVALARLEPKAMDNPRGELSLAQMARFEANTKAFGFVWLNEYLPRTVKALPPQLPSDPATMPAPQIELEKYNATQRAFTTNATEKFALRLRQFYFPDWQATIDGNPAPVYPSTALGLQTIDVPAGEHRVVLSSVETPARQVGAIISALGLAALLGLIARVAVRRDPDARTVLGVCAGLLAIIALPAFVALNARVPDLQSLQVNVSPQINLIGLTMDDVRLESGMWRVTNSKQLLHMQVYWQVKQSLADKPFAWRLVDGAGRVWTTREQLARYGTGFPAAWLPNEIVPDHYDLPLAARMPPGKYNLQVAFGDPRQFVSVSVIELVQGSAPASPEPQIARRVEARVGDGIRLLGYDAPATVRAGQSLPINLYWKAERDILEDLTVFVHLIDMDGKLIAQHDELTANGFNPTMLWVPGTIVPDKRAIVLPQDVQPGMYRLVAGMYRFDNMERLPVSTGAESWSDDLIELGTVKVPMDAQAARPQRALDISFGPAIRLAGFDLNPPSLKRGQTLDLRLYWQAKARLDADYKVFVHIVAEDGRVVTQQDSIPGSGKYPTHIWDADEQVLDPYRLPIQLPPARYRIMAGMYNAESGERLAAQANGEELKDRQVELGELNVLAP